MASGCDLGRATLASKSLRANMQLAVTSGAGNGKWGQFAESR